jgi:adenine-specific DNA methylase
VKRKQKTENTGTYQPTLFQHVTSVQQAPSTRYQGSKLKLLPWIWQNIKDIQFHTALDAFGGTGSVAYLLKSQGKAVTYNDYLKFNAIIATALIENQQVRLNEEDLDSILYCDLDATYDDFIARTFHDIYFTDEENIWLDTVCQNILRLKDGYKRALAYYALFQACMIKRPYNLFHRQNLYMRTADVERGFGNKKTWDRPFEEHFRNFVAEANDSVFDSGIGCTALCRDALLVPGTYDLVYIDTPYINKSGTGVDYLEFYHFLEGLTDYTNWGKRINYNRKHRPLKGDRSPWSDRKRALKAFQHLFERFADSVLVISYRSDGIPSETDLVKLLQSVKRTIRVEHYGTYKYVLSLNGSSKELLLIGQ